MRADISAKGGSASGGDKSLIKTMSELTKEYFDKKLDEKTKNFVTKEHFDEKVGELVTFKQLGTQLVILENNFDKKLSAMADELKTHAG